MHLLALTVDIGNDLPLVRNPGLLFFDQTICDALDLRPDRIQSIVMILDPVLLFLYQSSLKFIPTPSIHQLINLSVTNFFGSKIEAKQGAID